MITLLPQFRSNVDCCFLGKGDKRTVSEPCVRLNQVHGNRTVVLREPSDLQVEADGVITDVLGLNLTIRAADCQNFCIYHPEKHIAGILHAGWRGILSGAIPEFFRVLQEEFGAHAEETHVAAGPSLCLQCAEYADPGFELRKKIDPRFVHDNCVDLQAAAAVQLLNAGVPRDHIVRHPDCTCCNPKKYYTYRGGDREAVIEGISNVLVATLL